MPFQILCLSGGGFLGLYTATVVAGLEKEFGGPIAKHFDLISGTSIGGIIALGLAMEVPGHDIRTAFETNGTGIFSGRATPSGLFGRAADLCRSLVSSKYGDTALRAAVTGIIGEETLIGHLRHPCLIPAVNLSKGAPQVFKTDHHENFRVDLNIKAVDAAMATSAAPTYFPIAKINDSLYVDGGLYANSPDLLALHEAEHFFRVSIEDVTVLSIGTTTAKFSFPSRRRKNFGLLEWAMGARLVQTMISSQQQLADFMLRQRLGDRYMRLDAQQSREQQNSLSLDTATPEAQETIRSLASVTVQAALNDPVLRAMFEHRAETPRFYHRSKIVS
jgi:patatin-like phospholipase/acyl hydrolase